MVLAFLLAALQLAGAPDAPDNAAGAAEGAGRDYRIGPEDVLHIAVYGHPDLIQTVSVQADGSFAFPLVGRVEASDLAPPELERKLAELLARGFIRDPHVAVVVQQYRSKIVFVVGEVARPVLPTEVGAAAGGLAEVIRVDMRDLEAGDLAQNVELRPRDTVFVPAAPKVFVSGRVPKPGGYPFAPGTTVRQAVSLAGGSARSAGRVRVLREVGGRPQPVQVGLDDLVQAGDTIIVRGGLF
jgi:polysaccharide export outer membrane protein